MTLSFEDWKQLLLHSSGSASAPVRKLGDYVLELFWRDGCEPSISALLNYAQTGLHPAHQARSTQAITGALETPAVPNTLR
jgi:hypothetical protein